MSSSFTYAQFVTAMKNHAEDQGVNFGNNVNTLIKLGEDRVVRDLPLTIFHNVDDVTITQGDQTPTKPTGTIQIFDFYYLLSGERQFLEPRPYSYLLDYAPNNTQAAPKYYAEDYASSTDVYIAPAPNLTVTAEMFYLKRPASLVDTANGTFLSLNVGDLLLASCMIAAERYQMDPEKVGEWTTDYPLLLASAHKDFANLLPKSFKNIAPAQTV